MGGDYVVFACATLFTSPFAGEVAHRRHACDEREGGVLAFTAATKKHPPP
jgi:hypothetical protein